MSLFGIGAGTVANIAGSLLGNKLQGNSAKANAQMSLDSWKYMQSHKHQLEVEDLRKAGLNPVLSAGQGSAVSAPSVSGNPESQLGKNIADTLTAAKQLKIAEKEADIKDKEAETNLLNAKNQERLIDSSIDLNSALSAFHNSKVDEIRNNIKIAMEKLPYEIDVLASNSEANRAAAALSLASIDLVAAQKDLTIEQKKQIIADLNDPKRLASTEFWHNVFNSNEKKWQTIRESYFRGLEHDVLFSFYSDGSGSGLQNAESLSRIAGQLKYIATKGR